MDASQSSFWLEINSLLHGAGSYTKDGLWNNPYGRIPGEAASAILFSNSEDKWCSVLGAGESYEKILFDQAACTGVGLSAAANIANSFINDDLKITHLIHDLNGEPYRADQFGFTSLRISEKLIDNWKMYSPALVTSDLGTATALTHLALSAYIINNRKNKNTIERHLILTSSDDECRSTIITSS